VKVKIEVKSNHPHGRREGGGRKTGNCPTLNIWAETKFKILQILIPKIKLILIRRYVHMFQYAAVAQNFREGLKNAFN
jgi:hypothetical protein